MNHLKEKEFMVKNVVSFLVGYTRKILFWLHPCLIRDHILEQYLYRKKRANLCTERGSCLFCGCKTPELYYANKGCGLAELPKELIFTVGQREDVCYPPMMNKKEWLNFKKENNV